MVMDAARSAGARGGTVVHAKGTANDSIKNTFFGVTVAAEKEMIYIVSRKSDRDTIMKAIMEQAGAHTSAKAMVFSLPVDSVVGLRSITDIEEG
jgi:nitrogen regulatory protein PII